MKLEHIQAPDFELLDDTGLPHKLSDYLGKKLLIYFYPKDMTPGCTVEARGFRDLQKDFDSLGISIIGISTDPVESHEEFKNAHGLNFPLLSDSDHAVSEKYGVWVEKSMFGKKYMGISRESFLIDEKGIIIRHYNKVNPLTHPEEVLNDVRNKTK